MTQELTHHTPGPWKAPEHPSGEMGFVWQITPERPHHRHACAVGTVFRWGDLLAESEANARLIAASPDLLAACKAAVEVISDLDSEETGHVYYQLLKAIERAESSHE